MEQEMREGGEGTKVCGHEGECKCGAPVEESTQGRNEEIQLAFLLALMPLVVLTFFGQVGLI